MKWKPKPKYLRDMEKSGNFRCYKCGELIKMGTTFLIDEQGNPIHTVGDCKEKRAL